MKSTCLVGNLTELPSKFNELLTDPAIDVLATKLSSINSCYHLYFERFASRQYEKCIVIYGEGFGRYTQFDDQEGFVITPDSKYADVSYLHDAKRRKDDSVLATECHAFRLFILLYMVCHSNDMIIEVIDKGVEHTGDEFINRKLAQLGKPEVIDTRKGFSLHAYHNSHNEFITRYRNKEKLIIVLGDSWVVGDNKDNTKEGWHVGQLKEGFANLTAEHFDTDLVVCGSPGNSNTGSVLNFFMWYFHNKDFTSHYKDIKIIYSKTSINRDFTAKGNIGIWHPYEHLKEYAMMQTDEKLLRDCEIAIRTFDMFCNMQNVSVHYMFNHALELNDCVISLAKPGHIIGPTGTRDGYDLINYNQVFHNTDYQSVCLHPSDKGNRYLAQEVIKHLRGF